MVNPIGGYNPITIGALSIADPWRPSSQTTEGLFGMAGPAFPFMAAGLGGINSLFGSYAPIRASNFSYSLLGSNSQMASSYVFAGAMQFAMGLLGFSPYSSPAPAAAPAPLLPPMSNFMADVDEPEKKPKKEEVLKEPPVRPLTRAERRAAAQKANAESRAKARKEKAERATIVQKAKIEKQVAARKAVLDQSVVHALGTRVQSIQAHYTPADANQPHRIRVTMKPGERPEDVAENAMAVVQGADNQLSRQIRDLPEKWVPVVVDITVPKDSTQAVIDSLKKMKATDTHFIRARFQVAEYS